MSKNDENDNNALVLKNKKAFHDYEIIEKLECGVELRGTEVKSLRARDVNFAQAFARVDERGELILHGLHISPYKQGNRFNHESERVRKLLARKQEIRKLKKKTEEKGLTLVPLALYFKRGWLKVEIGVARGKALHDKRDSMRERDQKRNLARESHL